MYYFRVGSISDKFQWYTLLIKYLSMAKILTEFRVLEYIILVHTTTDALTYLNDIRTVPYTGNFRSKNVTFLWISIHNLKNLATGKVCRPTNSPIQQNILENKFAKKMQHPLKFPNIQ